MLRAVALRPDRPSIALVVSAGLIGLNWFVYVWAIQTGHVYAASLGYYVLPLVMMVLGMQMAGLIHIPFLERTYEVRGRVSGFGDDQRTIFVEHEEIGLGQEELRDHHAHLPAA